MRTSTCASTYLSGKILYIELRAILLRVSDTKQTVKLLGTLSTAAALCTNMSVASALIVGYRMWSACTHTHTHMRRKVSVSGNSWLSSSQASDGGSRPRVTYLRCTCNILLLAVWYCVVLCEHIFSSINSF